MGDSTALIFCYSEADNQGKWDEMHKLSFTLHSAQSIADPRQRAQLLTGAAIEEANTLALLVKVLNEAKDAATSIDDPEERERVLALVERAYERVGYDRASKSFSVPDRITA